MTKFKAMSAAQLEQYAEDLKATGITSREQMSEVLDLALFLIDRLNKQLDTILKI